MQKNIKTFFKVLPFLVCFFFFYICQISRCLAVTDVSQLEWNTYKTYYFDRGSTHWQFFKPVSSSFESATVKMRRTLSSSNFYAYLYKGTILETAEMLEQITITVAQQNNDLPLNIWSDIKLDFTNTTLIPGDTYIIVLANTWNDIAVQNSNVYNNGKYYYYNYYFGEDHFSDLYDMYFFTSTAYIPLSITSPLPDQDIGIGARNSIGTCPTIGENKLAWSWHYPYTDWDSSDFTHECLSDNTFIIPYNSVSGEQFACVTNIDWLDEPSPRDYIFSDNIACVTWSGYSTSTLESSLWISYPAPLINAGEYYQVQPSETFPFRFNWRLPNLNLTSSFSFKLERFTDKTYNTLADTLANNSIEYFDSEKKGYIDQNIDTSATSTLKYYKASLLDADDAEVYLLYFKVISANDETYPAPILPSDNKDLGVLGNSLRALFVPRKSFFTDYFSLKDTIKAKPPFFYYYNILDSFVLSTSTASSTLGLSMNFPVDQGSTTPIFIFSSANSLIHDFAAGIRIYISAGLYIIFGLYILHRIWDFDF